MTTDHGSQVWWHLPPAFGEDRAGQQLALSETLLADLNQPVLWWYSARETALILGTSQKTEVADLEACREAGIGVYRRTSGGAAVLAEPDFVSLDIALPPGHPLAPSDIVTTYRWLGTTWLETLKTLGLEEAALVATEAVRAEREAAKSWSQEQTEQDKLVRLVCFGSLSPYEVVAQGRKLVGLAQIRRRSDTLLQCGLPLHSQVERFADLLTLPQEKQSLLTRLLGERITSLDKMLTRKITAGEVVTTFEETLQKLWDVQFETQPWPIEKLALAARLEKEKFFDLATTPANK